MKLVREINCFVLVGLAATACNYGVALLAHQLMGLGPYAANTVGYGLAVGISYLGNSLLTFRRPVMHGPQFVRFALISLTGFAINQATVFVFAKVMGWPYWLALGPVVVIVPACTFVMSKFWAFRAPLDEAAI
jgi:putative flippase GtrA